MPVQFSILIPIYNRENFIPQLIASLKEQTFTDYEVIMVNDASTDNSLKLMQAATSEFDKIKLITYETNKNAAGARNEGLKHCQGNYICLLDSDDLLEPNALNRAATFLQENPDTDILTFDERKVTNDLETKYFLLKFTEDYYIKKQNLFRTAYGGAATIIRKSKMQEVGGYDSRMVSSNDRVLSLKLHNTCLVRGIPERLYIYREHDNNITKTKNNFKGSSLHKQIINEYKSKIITTESFINDWDQVKRFSTLKFDYSEVRIKKYANVILKCSLSLAQRGEKKLALAELEKANWLHPQPKYKIFKLFIKLGFKGYLDTLYTNMNAITDYYYDDFLLTPPK